MVALVLLAFMLVFSMLFDAPLGSKANPGLSPNPTKAPWYFMGIQEMLLHFHPIFALFVIPVLMLIALLALPYINYELNTAGVWFASTKGRRMALIAGLAALIGTPLGILADEYLIEVAARLPAVPTWITNGLVPACSAFGRDSGLLCFHATEVCGQQHRSRSNGVCASSGGFPRLDRHRHMVQGNGHEAVVAVEHGNLTG